MGKENLRRLLFNGKNRLLERVKITRQNNQGKYNKGVLWCVNIGLFCFVQEYVLCSEQ